MKVAIYARCSTKKQDLDSQKKRLIAWAQSQTANYIYYEDLAISGKKDSRNGIDSLLEAARKKEFDLLGVVELSRIGRSIKFIYSTVEELSKLGIKVVLVNTNTTLDYNSIEGRAMLGGLSLAADLEWMLIQERNARGREAIKDRGVKVGPKHKDLSIEAIKALQEKGLGYRKIAKELGVSAPTIMRRINGSGTL